MVKLLNIMVKLTKYNGQTAQYNGQTDQTLIIRFVHLHIDLAQLVLEKLATGSHHHFVHIDMMVLRI